MSNVQLVNCPQCGRQYNSKVLRKCPVCAAGAPVFIPPQQGEGQPQQQYQQMFQPQSQQPQYQQRSYSNKANYGKVAAQSASIVNIYGTVIQIAGAISAFFVFLYLFFSEPDYSRGFLTFIISMFVAAMVFLGALITGALYRMVSNYILFKVSE